MGDRWPVDPGAKRGGNKRTVDVREVRERGDVHAEHGLPVGGDAEGLAAAQHGERLPRRWDEDRTLDRIHHALYVLCREQAGREASPTAAIIDSQSVKSAEKGGAASTRAGYDAGKKIKGKKRHVLVDTQAC